MSQTVVEVKCLRTYRGAKCVLDIESLMIGRGELISVLGPNGAGKSTLLQVLNGLLPSRQGAARVLGFDLPGADTVQLRRRSSMVFQDPLFIHDTVYANVALPLRFRGLPEKVVRAKVETALAAFRCSHLSARLAQRLSGGETQRVCLARAFVTEPELVLLDEPFSSLDPATRNDLLAELKTFALAREVTVILVSHNLEEVLRFAQRALVLQEGRIVQDAPPGTMLRRPVNSIIARLAGMDNMWPCQVVADGEKAKVHVDEQIVFAAAGVCGEGKGWCCLTGDSFRIIEEGQQPERPWIPVDAMVDQVIPGIGVVKVLAKVGELPLAFCVTGDRAAGLSKGQRLRVAFSPTDAHILTE